VQAIQALRGVSLIVAAVIVTEIGERRASPLRCELRNAAFVEAQVSWISRPD
jgi:hypothetical protein